MRISDWSSDVCSSDLEIPSAHLALMLQCREAALGSGELGLLQIHERAHLVAGVTVGEVEHAVVERMEAGQGDELELVAHRCQLALERSDGGVVEMLQIGRAHV